MTTSCCSSIRTCSPWVCGPTLEHVLVPPASVGAELVKTDRGGDVTYHGPGQLVGYPILSVPMGPGATPRYVRAIEQLIIDVLADLGLAEAGRAESYPGVWVGDRKICAVGVRLTRGRSMHGFALNVDPDLSMFDHIVACGIADRGVTSLAAEGVSVSMSTVVDAVVGRAWELWGPIERQDVSTDRSCRSRARHTGFTATTSVEIGARKPEWLRVKANMGEDFRAVRRTMRSLDLVTVCEEAGCPNIFECWSDGTATFMINGDRCTRACGFCLVDTRRPFPVDPLEPEHVAEAVERMGLAHAVVTAVARDDLPDGGAQGFSDVIRAIRRRTPGTAVEVLIPDCKGDPAALDAIFAARPDVLNHNLETVARLQRAVRPSASYARSLSVLGRAAAAGLVTKSGLILGMGERADEVRSALVDLRNVGVDIVTLGQYLRPTADHLPVARWLRPDEFDDFRRFGEGLGFAHVQSSPLTRSSYHARQAVLATTS